MHQTHLLNFFLSLPYFGQFSEKVCSELLVLLGRHFSDVRFDVVLVNKFTVGSFFNYKDKLPMHLSHLWCINLVMHSVYLSTPA